MFLPDESTLAGRLCALASAAELGLLTAEYQHKRQSRGVRFSHAPRPSGFFNDYTLPQLFAAEAFTGATIMNICLHCYTVRAGFEDLTDFWFGGRRGGAPLDFCSDECKQAAERARQRTGRQKKRCYIRFGLWDTRTETSVNVQTGQREPGVSAYDAFYDPEDGCYRLDTAKVAQYARQAKRCLPLLYDRHIFIITGDETEPGTDNEPCLRNIRLIAPAIWRNQQIIPVPLERLLWLAEALGFGPDTSAGAVPPINSSPAS